jgi:FkbM family methyltransferase
LVRSANYSCWVGTYEGFKQHEFARAIKAGAVVFDIGAHVGYYSLIASARSGPRGSVFAFEPLHANAEALRRHVRLNRVNVTIIEAAVGEQESEAYFQKGRDTYTGRLADEGTPVRVVTIDALRASGQLPPPNVLKVDVEGAEGQVLRGALETLKTVRPLVFLAVHGQRARDDAVRVLAEAGYGVTPLVENGDRPDELVAAHRPTGG